MEYQKFLWIIERSERYYAAMAYISYFWSGLFFTIKLMQFWKTSDSFEAYAIAILH